MHSPLAGLKQQNGHLTQVEVDEMLRLMSHIAAKVPPNDAVPGWVIFLVKLLWDKITLKQRYARNMEKQLLLKKDVNIEVKTSSPLCNYIYTQSIIYCFNGYHYCSRVKCTLPG